jgi:hypothetical protein
MATRGEKGRKTYYGRALTGTKLPSGSKTRKTAFAGHTGSRVPSGNLSMLKGGR